MLLDCYIIQKKIIYLLKNKNNNNLDKNGIFYFIRLSNIFFILKIMLIVLKMLLIFCFFLGFIFFFLIYLYSLFSFDFFAFKKSL